MSKKSTPNSSARQDAMERFQRFLDDEEQRRDHEDPRAMVEAVWSRARGALFVNVGSTGRATLDAIIRAAWNGEDPTSAWEGPVHLLPPLSRQREIVAIDDGEFSLGDKRPADATSVDASEPPKKKAMAKAKPKSKASAEAKPPKSPSAPKPSGSGKGKAAATAEPSDEEDSSEQDTSEQAEADLPTIGFELAEDVPRQIRSELFKVFHHAATQNKSPFQLAYPWSGARLWYDPVKYPKVHLAHWRFWNGHRRIFWMCAIHPPLPAGPRQAYYRKQKMKACRARLQFLSCCIEAWGYVAFLKLLDEADSHLLWLGGRPGRHSPNGTKESGGVDEDLAALFASDKAHYRRRIKNALDPKLIDEDGYSSVTELLEQTSALDPDKEAYSRFSDRALALIFADLVAEKPFKNTWIPDSLKPVFKKVRNDDRILAISISDELHEPKVSPYLPKESKRPGYSLFQRADESYTALAPRKGGVVKFPSASKVKNTPASGKAAAKSQAKAKAAAEALQTASDEEHSAGESNDEDHNEASNDEAGADEDDEASGDEDSEGEAEVEFNPPPSASTSSKRAQRTPKTRSSSSK